MTSHKHPILNAYVSLGSNLGDRAGNLLLGVRGMMEAGLDVIRLSSVYETEPVGVSSDPPVRTSSQPSFLNMVAELRGNSLPAPEQMLARMMRVEYALDRRRETPMAPRTIDLDLLLYKNETRANQFLSLPHPRLHLRRFVLTPLAELVPRLVHPTLNTSIADLLERLEDQSRVVRWRPNASQGTT
ncbi:MAG TPA: 2-amino-4-hydroxy-6-hydroxymethyldihydropteridine diphosphokinase [Pyrinomonadaceae bacterium]|nr:2-amino-4-hydroxy-6-hydroxymethyldihydropteridine diphosphokinase [Pyrinomonadaceae bacterium]